MIAAQHIKELRIEHNYSQEYLANELDISQKTYSNIENGKTKLNLDHLIKLSKVFNMDMMGLFDVLSSADAKTIKNIKREHPKIKAKHIYHGVNGNISNDIIHHMQERINTLERLVESKQTMIEILTKEIKDNLS